MKEYPARLVIRELPDGETTVVCAQANDARGHQLYDIVIHKVPTVTEAPAADEKGPVEEGPVDPAKTGAEIGPDGAGEGETTSPVPASSRGFLHKG